MRTIFFILRKEFTQLRRNKSMLPIIFIVPLFQLLILVNAATLEMKNITVSICDNDMSSSSRQLISKFEGSPFFSITNFTFDKKDAQEDIVSNKSNLVIIIPQNFERDLMRENKTQVQLLFNAINGTVAGIGNAYAQQIIMSLSNDILKDMLSGSESAIKKQIKIIPSFWYNPEMNYKVFMVPAILVILVTIIGMMLAAMNIVREKEMGTIEQINVTPIKKIHFIIGKLLPFWLIALFMLAFGLLVGKLIFNIPLEGNLGLLFLVAAIYLLVMQGFGLILSNTAETQQQAMFIAFFILIVFIMMGGIFTPVESMPQWAQTINLLNPIAYFMKLIRMILLKGSGMGNIYPMLLKLIAYAVVVLTIAVLQYKKRS